MNKRAWFGVVVALVSLMGVTTGASAQPDRERHRPFKHPVLAASLLDEAGLVPVTAHAEARGPWTDERGAVLVEVNGNAAQVRDALAAVGATTEADAYGVIEAYVPTNRLRDLAGKPGVEAVYEPLFAEPHVISEGVAETGMAAWHLPPAQIGAGVTVAVVDVGFAGLAAAQTAGEIPMAVQTQDHCDNPMLGGPIGSPGITHGTAVAEIVRDMAPGATLRLVCVDTLGDFTTAVANLPADVDIVNASIGNALWGRGDGSGPAGTAVGDSRLAGKLWTVSAGNEGDRHFNFTGTTVDEFGSVVQGPNDVLYLASVEPNGAFDVSVKWDAWPTTNLDFDVLVYASFDDYINFNPIATSEAPQPGGPGSEPVERVAFTSPFAFQNTYLIEILAFEPNDNPAGRRFDLFLDGDLAAVERVTASSISEPASSPYVMTVGAHHFNTGAREPFSSQGPTIDGRVKPDISGPDAVDTFTFTGPFFGTSSAAPHTAGAAAVLLGANSTLDAAELQAILERRALDTGTLGLDIQFGFGRLRMGATGTPTPPTGDLYVAVDPPVRVVDTRLASNCGFPTCGALGPGAQRVLTAAGQTFGGVTIPADATAIVFNVTGVSPTATGFVTVYPTGGARPTAANLTTRPGYTRGNHVTATVGQNGQITFYNAAGNLHLVVDLAGWYSPSEGEVGLVPLNPPTRAVDTRPGAGCVGPQCSILGPGAVLTLPIAGHNIGNPPLPLIPVSAQAVVLNVTVTSPTANGFITVWPGGDRPNIASLNFGPGQTIPNLVIATVGTGGNVSFYNGGNGSSHLIVDVLGYFDVPTNPDASRYVALKPPRRNLDTRFGNGPRLGPLTPSEVFNHQTRLLYGVPNDATAVLMNISVSNPTLSGFLTAFPEGFARPRTANLNWLRGDVVPNAAISSIGASGRISLYNGGGGFTPTIVDLAGYYIPG